MQNSEIREALGFVAGTAWLVLVILLLTTAYATLFFAFQDHSEKQTLRHDSEQSEPIASHHERRQSTHGLHDVR
jgi:hypothetical protein